MKQRPHPSPQRARLALQVGLTLLLILGVAGVWRFFLQEDAKPVAPASTASRPASILKDGPVAMDILPPQSTIVSFANFTEATKKLRDLIAQFPPGYSVQSGGGYWSRSPETQPVTPIQIFLPLKQAVIDLVNSLAWQDPVGTMVWAQDLPGDISASDRLGLMVLAAGAAAESQPAMAADFVQQMPADAVAAQLDRRVAQTWAQTDIPAALAWADSLSKEGAGRQHAIMAVLIAMAKTDPVEAWVIGLKYFVSDHYVSGLTSIALTWGSTDPVAAGNALASLPSSEFESGRSFAMVNDFMRSWTMRDGPGAAAWLATLPKSAFQAMAAASLSDTQQVLDEAKRTGGAIIIVGNTMMAGGKGVVRASPPTTPSNSATP